MEPGDPSMLRSQPGSENFPGSSWEPPFLRGQRPKQTSLTKMTCTYEPVINLGVWFGSGNNSKRGRSGPFGSSSPWDLYSRWDLRDTAVGSRISMSSKLLPNFVLGCQIIPRKQVFSIFLLIMYTNMLTLKVLEDWITKLDTRCRCAR